MKVAWVTLAVIVSSILGLVLISLFGDITVTNQQDYSLMKNAVEASMMDSKDLDAYQNGICICTNKDKINNKYFFSSYDDYYVQTIPTNGQKCSDLNLLGKGANQYKTCIKRVGVFKINTDVFAASFVRRFAESVKGDNEYKIDILDVSEYPPKASVRISSYDNYNVSSYSEATFNAADYSVVNELDGIIEYTGSIQNEDEIEVYIDTPKPEDDIEEVIDDVVSNDSEPPKSLCKQGKVNVILVIDAGSSMSSFAAKAQIASEALSKRLSKNGVKLGYTTFNSKVRKSTAITYGPGISFTTNSGSNVGLGIACGIKMLGYNVSETNSGCTGTPIKNYSDNVNYMIILSDGYYYNNNYNVSESSKSVDSSKELKTWMDEKKGNGSLKVYAVTYGCATGNGSNSNEKSHCANLLSNITGSSSRVFATKYGNLSDLDTIYSSIEAIILKNC